MWQTQYVPAKTSHIIHLMLTFLTLGFWSPVWFFVWLYNHNRMVPRRYWVPLDYTPQYRPGAYPGSPAPLQIYPL
jgi:hypothetical protein